MRRASMTTITFDNQLKEFILSIFHKQVNSEGFVVEKENPKQHVLAPDGQEVRLEQFAGIKRGSEIFIKSDLISLMNLCDSLT